MKKSFAGIERSNDARYFETKEGVFIAPLNLKYFTYIAKVDLSDMTYIPYGDDDYNASDLPTFNELIKQGLVFDKTYCKEYDIEIEDDNFYSCWDCEDEDSLDIDAILQEFEDNGFNVSRDAIIHNYEAWLGDLKSGYRGHDYHLFTPCGCNRLSFRATSLDEHFDWQITYEC